MLIKFNLHIYGHKLFHFMTPSTLAIVLLQVLTISDIFLSFSHRPLHTTFTYKSVYTPVITELKNISFYI